MAFDISELDLEEKKNHKKKKEIRNKKVVDKWEDERKDNRMRKTKIVAVGG